MINSLSDILEAANVRDSTKAALDAVRALEADQGVSLGGTWQHRLSALVEKGYLRQPMEAAADIVRKVNVMVHELHAARWGGVAFRVIDKDEELIPNAYAEADLHLQKLVVQSHRSLDHEAAVRSVALVWLHELGINADGLAEPT